MASFADVTAGRSETTKQRGINIRLLDKPDSSAENIVASLIEHVPSADIETVQPMPGKGNWVVVFSREEHAEKIANETLAINGELVQARRVVKPRFIHASVSFVPPDVSNSQVKTALEPFAEVINIRDQYMREYGHIKTGKRIVILKPHDTLPAYFDVEGYRASLHFQGRIACCPYCDDTSHLGRNCPNKRAKKLCFKCKLPGHFKRDCPEMLALRAEQQPTPETNDMEIHEEDYQADTEEGNSHSDQLKEGEEDKMAAKTADEVLMVNLPHKQGKQTQKPPRKTSFKKKADTRFIQSDTEFNFKPPAPAQRADREDPSPPAEFFALCHQMTKGNPVAFYPPEEARHKMPPVMPTVPGDKRKEHFTPRQARSRHKTDKTTKNKGPSKLDFDHK